MRVLQHLNRISIWLLIVTATLCSFPWSEKLSSWGIILLVLHWLFDKDLIKKIRSFEWNRLSISMLSFFAAYILWLFWSDDKHTALHSIESRLSFLILPFLFSTEHYFYGKEIKSIMNFFVISCLFSLLFNIGHSIYSYRHFGYEVVWNRMYLAYTIWHPGYFSNYYVVAIFFISYHLLDFKNNSGWNQFLYLISLPLFILFTFLLMSKISLLVLALFFVLTFIFSFPYIKSIWIRLVSTIVACIILSFVLANHPAFKLRMLEMTEITSIKKEEVRVSNSSNSRVATYTTATHLIIANPLFGYGTGDANYELRKKLHQEGYVKLAKDNMAVHNQYMTSWIELGLIGIFLFVLLLYNFAWAMPIKMYPWSIWVWILFALSCLVENMIESQASNVFFIFLMSLLAFMKYNKKPLPLIYSKFIS
ncbi:MAG: O-antigen ligase family protein [Chitinophagaceae bacterium]